MTVASIVARPITATELWIISRKIIKIVLSQLLVCLCGGIHNWQAEKLVLD